jgi:hypothetical protein
MKTLLTAALCVSICSAAVAQTADFQDLSLPPNAHYNGADGAGGFTSGGVRFANNYNAAWSSWSGFAYSNETDTTTAGFANQYSAFAGGGAGSSSIFGVGYAGSGDAVVTLPAGQSIASASFTNTTYAALSMRDGDAFAKKFGGATGNDADFFRLTVTGLDAAKASVGSVDVYLADYRFANNASDYILNGWTDVNLSSLAAARELKFTLASSDNGAFGMNTPAYFALDNLTTVPEPAAMGLFAVAGIVALRRRSRR